MRKIIFACIVSAITIYRLSNIPANAQSRSISIDDMTTVLATLVAVGNSCPQKFRPSGDSPLREVVKSRGYDLEDFTPNSRYGKLMEARMLQSVKYIKLNGTVKACTEMRELIQQDLPELYTNSLQDKKIRITNELITQHYRCYSALLDSSLGDDKECDDRLRQQLNQNGLCEYTPERIRYRFCKNFNKKLQDK
jgi:hypothetical protein